MINLADDGVQALIEYHRKEEEEASDKRDYISAESSKRCIDALLHLRSEAKRLNQLIVLTVANQQPG